MKTMHIVMPYAADDWGSDDEYEIEEKNKPLWNFPSLKWLTIGFIIGYSISKIHT